MGLVLTLVSPHSPFLNFPGIDHYLTLVFFFFFFFFFFFHALFKASVWSTIVTAEAGQGRGGEGNSQTSEAGIGGSVRRDEEDESFYSDDVTPQPRYR